MKVPGQPPNNNNAPPPPGTATLRGHVLAADTGLPLRKAQVRIMAGDIRENRLATTDADGKFEFKEVRAGRYTISASKGSYVGLSYGQQRPTDAPKPLQILDNQTVERLDFSLPRGSVITGRIVDEFGEPMSDVQIAPQYYQTMQGQRRLVPTGRQTSTDDMGEFRLFGIPPGQYYLTATWRSTNPMNNEDKTAYAPMYFPGTDNPAQAQRITLAVGQQISDIVMALKPMRATRVSGTATTSDGRPMTGSIMVMSTGGFGFNMSAGAGPIRPDGTFSINGIAPGEYTLRAQSFGPGGMAGFGDRDRQDHRDRRGHHRPAHRRREAVGRERTGRDRSRHRRNAASRPGAHADADGAGRDADGHEARRGWPTTGRSS